MKLTKEQQRAILELYKRNSDNNRSFLAFRRKVKICGTKNDLYAGIGWCGMFVGIEKDGETHT